MEEHIWYGVPMDVCPNRISMPSAPASPLLTQMRIANAFGTACLWICAPIASGYLRLACSICLHVRDGEAGARGLIAGSKSCLAGKLVRSASLLAMPVPRELSTRTAGYTACHDLHDIKHGSAPQPHRLAQLAFMSAMERPGHAGSSPAAGATASPAPRAAAAAAAARGLLIRGPPGRGWYSRYLSA